MVDTGTYYVCSGLEAIDFDHMKKLSVGYQGLPFGEAAHFAGECRWRIGFRAGQLVLLYRRVFMSSFQLRYATGYGSCYQCYVKREGPMKVVVVLQPFQIVSASASPGCVRVALPIAIRKTCFDWSEA